MAVRALLLALLLVIAGATDRASACDCSPGLASDAFEQSDIVFVGRVGPSVGILIDDDDRLLRVGPSSGQWHGPATLRWAIAGPAEVLAVPGAGADAVEVDALLAGLGEIVDSVAAEQAHRLVTCRYCGSVVAPEHALGDELCQGCGSRVFGIVY